MALKLSNFISTVLSNSTNGSQTTIVVSSVTGFPSITTPVTDYFFLTIVRASDNAKEIVKVTDYTGSTLTVVRAQEGTTGLAFAAGDAVGLRFTKQTIIDLIAEEAAARIAAVVLESQFGALTIPASAIKDTAIIARHITPAIIDETHLAASVAGAALDGGAGTALAVKYDNASISLNGSGQLTVKPASLTGAYTTGGKFLSFVSVGAGSTSAGIVYEGTRPHAGLHGNAGSGARFVCLTIGNSHATEDLIIGIRIGSTLSYYDSTGSDTGAQAYTGVRIKNTGFFVAGTNYMTFGFLVPAGYKWMVENENGTTGTPVIASHTYWEFA